MFSDGSRAERLLEEIRDLLVVIAGPQLAERDRKARELVVQITGRSVKRRRALFLIDGIQRRVDIQRDAEIDQSDFSKYISALKDAGVCVESERVPKLLITIDESMFPEKDGNNG